MKTKGLVVRPTWPGTARSWARVSACFPWSGATSRAGRSSGCCARRASTASLHRDRGLSTTQKLRVIGRRQQLLRIDFEKPPSGEVLASKLEEFKRELPDCEVVILSDYGKGGLAHIAEMISERPPRRQAGAGRSERRRLPRYKGASIITPNVAELREVVGRWKDEKDLKQPCAGIARQARARGAAADARRGWHDALRAGAASST